MSILSNKCSRLVKDDVREQIKYFTYPGGHECYVQVENTRSVPGLLANIVACTMYLCSGLDSILQTLATGLLFLFNLF